MIEIVVAAGSQKLNIHQFFTIVDDDINEPAESFVIVAEIENVSENIRCFNVTVGSDCNGQRGATEIRINNSKYCSFHIMP